MEPNVLTAVNSSPVTAFASGMQQAPKSGSARAKEVSDLFIQTLSSAEPPSHWGPSFALEDLRVDLEKLLTPEDVSLLTKTREAPEFYVVGQGHYHTVFGHQRFPKVVFKIFNLDKAKSHLVAAQKASTTACKIHKCWVQIPGSMVIECGDKGVYIEEKLPLENPNLSSEIWDRIVTHYYSSNATEQFKSNMHLMIEHIQKLIIEVGYWDVSAANLPAMRTDGQGVCGIDFENIPSVPKPEQLGTGFDRLAIMIPIEPTIKKNREQLDAGIPNFSSIESSPERREEIFEHSLTYRLQYIKTVHKALTVYDACEDANKERNAELRKELNYAPIKDKKALLKKLYSRLDYKRDEVLISEQRMLRIQPWELMADGYTLDGFATLLNFLQENRKIVAWIRYEGLNSSSECSTYTIFF